MRRSTIDFLTFFAAKRPLGQNGGKYRYYVASAQKRLCDKV